MFGNIVIHKLVNTQKLMSFVIQQTIRRDYGATHVENDQTFYKTETKPANNNPF